MQWNGPALQVGTPDCASEALRIGVLYEDSTACQQAMRTLARTYQRLRALDPGISISFCLWRLDLLKNEAFLASIRAAAANLDLIILSVSNREEDFRPETKLFVQSLLGGGECRIGAVVALLGPEAEPDALETPRYQFIERAAAQAGIQFFAPLRPSAPSRVTFREMASRII